MRKLPERTCVGCRKVCPAPDLLCLIAPEGQVRLARRGSGQSADEAGGNVDGALGFMPAACRLQPRRWAGPFAGRSRFPN